GRSGIAALYLAAHGGGERARLGLPELARVERLREAERLDVDGEGEDPPGGRDDERRRRRVRRGPPRPHFAGEAEEAVRELRRDRAPAARARVRPEEERVRDLALRPRTGVGERVAVLVAHDDELLP